MGFNTDDENIVISKEIAKKRNIEYEFIETSLGLVHPNTVKIEFIDENNNTFSITGSSIGGGKAKIIGINDIKLNFTGEFPTIILRYKDRKGVVLEASSLIYNANINIANLKINRLKGIATFILELDEPFNEMLLNQFKGLKDIDLCIGINSI